MCMRGLSASKETNRAWRPGFHVQSVVWQTLRLGRFYNNICAVHNICLQSYLDPKPNQELRLASIATTVICKAP